MLGKANLLPQGFSTLYLFLAHPHTVGCDLVVDLALVTSQRGLIPHHGRLSETPRQRFVGDMLDVFDRFRREQHEIERQEYDGDDIEDAMTRE